MQAVRMFIPRKANFTDAAECIARQRWGLRYAPWGEAVHAFILLSGARWREQTISSMLQGDNCGT